MKYFKVVDHIDSETLIDTKQTNYSLTLFEKDNYKNLLDFITQSSNELDLPLDFYFSLNNNIALLGNNYLQSLPNSVNRVYEISTLTSNSWHKGIYINEYDLIDVIKNLDMIGFLVFEKGFYLWEYIYEKIRVDSFPNKPSREESFFLFDNLKNCEYYINRHKGGGQICEVEIMETHSLFKADMNLLDLIPNNSNYKQTKKYVSDYWLGKITTDTIFEYLFQGECKLKPFNISNQ